MTLPGVFINGTVYCNRFDLPQGQWVLFEHSKQQISKETAGPFKVLRQRENRLDLAIFILQNEHGALFDYCPSLSKIGSKELPYGFSVQMIRPELHTESDLVKIKKKALERLIK